MVRLLHLQLTPLNHQRRRGRGEMVPFLDSFGATISSSTDFRLFFLLFLD